MCVRRLGRAAALMGSRGLEANRLPVAIPLLRGSHANRLSLCSTITIWPRRSSPPALSMTAASMTPSHSKAAAGLAAATIAQLWQETPSVRGLRLRLEQPGSFTFAPGNWLDLHAPGLQHAVGGYSITSSPQQLRREQGADAGTIDLCVKRSRHPVAEWVHSQAQPGAQVLLKVGGSFTLPPGVLVGDPLLFIAGGIGITALASMLATLAEQVQPAAAAQRAAAARRPMLLYSAASADEFARLPQLLEWQQRGALDLQLFTTRSHGAPAPGVVPQQGRIGQQQLAAALQRLRASHHVEACDVLAFLCGPPAMTDELSAVLQQLGVTHVGTERWW